MLGFVDAVFFTLDTPRDVGLEQTELPSWTISYPRSRPQVMMVPPQRTSPIPGTLPSTVSLFTDYILVLPSSNILDTTYGNVVINQSSSSTTTCISSTLSGQTLKLPSICCTIAMAPPSSTPIIHHTTAEPSYCHSSSSSETPSSCHNYYLRSLSLPHSGETFGIGPSQDYIPNKTRGRPSTLAKAIKRANLEVEVGTQSSLMPVLRAIIPLLTVTS